MAVAWNYGGAATVTATCTGLLPSASYTLSCDDPNSTGDTASADGSGNVTLTVTSVGGMTAGDGFGAFVQETGVSNFPAAAIFKFGTPATSDQGIVLNVTFDGIDTFVLTLPASVNGQHYEWAVFDGVGLFDSDTFTGNGATIVRTIVSSPTPSSIDFVVLLYNLDSGPEDDLGVKIFSGSTPTVAAFHICS